jgi:hypothetical protein
MRVQSRKIIVQRKWCYSEWTSLPLTEVGAQFPNNYTFSKRAKVRLWPPSPGLEVKNDVIGDRAQTFAELDGPWWRSNTRRICCRRWAAVSRKGLETKNDCAVEDQGNLPNWSALTPRPDMKDQGTFGLVRTLRCVHQEHSSRKSPYGNRK